MLIQLTLRGKPVEIGHDDLQFIIMEGSKRHYYRSIKSMAAYLVNAGLEDRDDIRSLDELKEAIIEIETSIAKSIADKVLDCVLKEG